MANWYGLFGPRGLPPAIVARLERELAAMRTIELMVQRTTAAGIALKLSSSDVLRERMATEVPRWKKIAGSVRGWGNVPARVQWNVSMSFRSRSKVSSARQRDRRPARG